MAKTSKGKPKAKDKSQISIGGDLTGNNNVVGSNNVVTNIYFPENIKLNALHQLPPAPADFTGRAELISQLLSDFNSHKGATISGLTGMGGIGKTALGLEVANKIKNQYQDAQIFLDLKGTTAPLSTLDIARHVILSFGPTADLRGLDESNMQAAYQSVLHGKKALLFFDNARSAEQIAPLRPPADCAMLVTSRWTFSVAGLQARRVDVLSEDDAIKFLLELCPRIAGNAADLAMACAYLPLALRIAGSFLLVNSDWSIEKYLSQLSDRKKRLETLKQSRTDAELTAEPDLLATFELSYTALAEADRKRWRTLGVFPASFAGNAAQAMWRLDEELANTLLRTLRRYSLLDYDATTLRYFLHDLLADYAIVQMEGEEEQEARISHAIFYMNIMRAADYLYLEGGEKTLQGLRLFDLEWAHVSSAFSWAAISMKDINEAANLCNYKTPPYCLNLRIHPRLQIEWLNAALLASQILKDREGEGIHFGNLGLAYADLGDARKAVEFHEQALTIDREIGDRRGEGADLGNLGIAYHSLGEVKKAIEFYEQQLLINREIGERRGEGGALNNLGLAYADLGDARKAIQFYEQKLVLVREIGERRGEGNALFNIGLALHDLEEKDKAIELMNQALVIFEAIESPSAENARNVLKEWGA
jgi:tetratricopeptide (TPR) repeat protein